MKKSLDILTRGAAINTLFFLLVFLPNNPIGSAIQVVITVFILSLSKVDTFLRFNSGVKPLKLLLLFFIALSLFYGAINESTFYFSSSLKIFNILILFLLFPITGNFVISDKFIFIAISFILLTQLCYLLNITPLINIIENYYSAEEYFNSSEITALEGSGQGLLSFRFGGIFRNPNQCGRIVSLLYAIYLVNNKVLRKSHLVVLAVFAISVLLTGSRTTFLAFLLLTSLYFFYLNVNIGGRILYFLPVLLVVAIPFINLDARIFDFSELSGSGKNASANAKYDFLLSYLENTSYSNPLKLLFGSFNLDDNNYQFAGVHLERFDSEFGYLLHGIGFLGVIGVVLMYVYIFVSSEIKTRFIMTLLLWNITSTVLTSFRFSILFFIVLSFYYYKKNKNKVEYER